MFWNIQGAQVLSRTERVRTRKWKAVAEVVQLKQRERDFLPWKLHLFWIYTNYLLTFDQQLLEHLFQVLQEKKIIFKSTGEVRTRWQGMTSFFRYALILKDQFLSSIVTQSKASWHIKVHISQGLFLITACASWDGEMLKGTPQKKTAEKLPDCSPCPLPF